MAKRLDSFPGEGTRGQRRYPWDEWTDGSPWEIRKGDDYDVPTENMRVNLHMKASSLARKVRTKSFNEEEVEGLIFQFYSPRVTDDVSTVSDGPATEPDPVESLYRDALEIYEIARREVTIPRRDGTRQKYAPVRYRDQIKRAHSKGDLVSAIDRIVSRRTEGFGHLEEAKRPDLMVETLVLDTEKPYHGLFSATTVQAANDRMAEYEARHGDPPSPAVRT